MEQYKNIELAVSEFILLNCFLLPVCPELEDEKVDANVGVIKSAL